MYIAFLTYSSYFDHIAEEINDRLQEYGLVTIADLTKEYNLPGDVLTQVCMLVHLNACYEVVNSLRLTLILSYSAGAKIWTNQLLILYTVGNLC